MAVSVILAGGGLKSAVAAARIAADGELCLLHVDYGQRSAKSELEALRDLSRTFKSAYVWPLTTEFVKQLEQSRPRGVVSAPTTPTPEDHQTATTMLAQRGLAVTLLSIGLQAAQRLGSPAVITGFARHCEAEHIGLARNNARPDQMREIIHGMNIVAESLTLPRAPVRFEAPLVDLSYGEIVKLAYRLNLRAEHTWSCAAKGTHPCGECSRCKERDRAYREARLADPAIRAVTR